MCRLDFLVGVVLCIAIFTPISLGLQCHVCEESTGKDGQTLNGTCLNPGEDQIHTIKECEVHHDFHERNHHSHHEKHIACETLIFHAGQFHAVTRRCTRVTRDFKEGCNELGKTDVEYDNWIKRHLAAAGLEGVPAEEIEEADTQVCLCDDKDGCNFDPSGATVMGISGVLVVISVGILGLLG